MSGRTGRPSWRMRTIVRAVARGAGIASMAPSGGEVLSMLTLAVHTRVPVATLKEMIYAYPTFHRAIEAALADLHE